MTAFDFNQNNGLFLVGLPEKNLILLTALSEKLGQDIPTIIAKSIVFLANNVLSEAERKELHKKMK